MSHAPKQRALEAYVAEQLSPRAALRLERHLDACLSCRETLPQVRTYARLRAEAADIAVPGLTWERLEAALDAEPRSSVEARGSAREQDREQNQVAAPQAGGPAARRLPVLLARGPARFDPRMRGKWIALAWPALAVAATLAIAWMGLHGAPAPEARVPSKAASVAEVAVPRAGRVTLVAGEVWLEHAGTRSKLTLASEVPEGARLITQPAALVHVLLDDGTGFALGAEGSVRLAELREAGIQLDLERGSVASQVHKLEPHQHYVVTLGGLSARVRGTRFLVEGDASGQRSARVFVHEGQVEVAQDGEIVALLGPGQSFERPTPGVPTPAPSERKIQGIDVSPAAFADAWGTLTLPALSGLHAWILQGERVAPQGGLSMRLPRGTAQLTFEDARSQIRSITLDLRERETVLEPTLLAKLVAPKEARVGSLEPEQITGVIRAGIEPLRRCYERGLRVLPTLAGKLTLRMRVGADGRVQRAEPGASSQLPPEISRCISQEAQRLVFPKPEGGGPVSFEVPLNLKSKSH